MALNRWLWAMMVVLACIGMLQWIEHPVILNYLGLGAAAVLAVVGCSKKCREFANKGPGQSSLNPPSCSELAPSFAE